MDKLNNFCQKHFKEFLIIVCLLVALVFLGHYYYIINFSWASINAKNYLKKKYDMDVKVLNVSNDTLAFDEVFNLSDDKNGFAYVKVKSDKTFYVYVKANESNEDGKDNYQYEVIKNDLLSKYQDMLGVSPINNYLIYGYNAQYITSDSVYNGMVGIYYDKNNLEEVSRDYHLNMEYSDIDLSKVDNKVIENGLNKGIVNLIVLRDDRKIMVDNHKKIDYNNQQIFDNAINVQKYVYINYNQIQVYDFDEVMKDFQGIKYVNQTDNDLIEISLNENDQTNYEYTKLTDSYNVKTDNDLIEVFYPIDKISDYKKYQHLFIIKSYIKEDKENYYIDDNYQVLDDYLVFRIDSQNYQKTWFSIYGK